MWTERHIADFQQPRQGKKDNYEHDNVHHHVHNKHDRPSSPPSEASSYSSHESREFRDHVFGNQKLMCKKINEKNPPIV